MSNLMDYLEWRGDLTFDNSPVNEVDNLIFCLASDFLITYSAILSSPLLIKDLIGSNLRNERVMI